MYVWLFWLSCQYLPSGSVVELRKNQWGDDELYGQLADKPTRRQTNSPTDQLADNLIKLAKKTNSPKLKLSPKSM